MAIDPVGAKAPGRVFPGRKQGRFVDDRRHVRRPKGVLATASDEDDIFRQLRRLRRFVETGDWDFNAPRGTYLNLLL